MQKVTVQVPMSKDLKEKAELASADLGFSSLQEVIRVLLTKLSKREFDIKIEETAEEITHLSKAAEKKFKKAVEDIKKGKNISPAFEDVDEAIAWLNDPKAKYQN